MRTFVAIPVGNDGTPLMVACQPNQYCLEQLWGLRLTANPYSPKQPDWLGPDGQPIVIDGWVIEECKVFLQPQLVSAIGPRADFKAASPNEVVKNYNDFGVEVKPWPYPDQLRPELILPLFGTTAPVRPMVPQSTHRR